MLRGGSRLNSDGPAKYLESREEADSEDSIDRLAEENAVRVGDAERGAGPRG